MRAFRAVRVGLLVLTLAAAAWADSHEGLLQEVTEIGDALAQAMIDNDVEAMFAMYADDAISLPNFGPRMQGVEAFRAHHAQMSESGMKILSFDSSPTEAWEAGDMVIEIGTFEISLEMPGAPDTIHDKGKYMTVYARGEDGSLKIKAETWNTDMNPMEMMPPGHEHGPESGDEPEAEQG